VDPLVLTGVDAGRANPALRVKFESINFTEVSTTVNSSRPLTPSRLVAT